MRYVPLLYLALALVLLWLPTGVCLGRRRRRELREPARDSQIGLPRLLASPWSWVDLLRAGFGSWLVVFQIPLLGLLQALHVSLAPNVQIPDHYQYGWIAFQLGSLLLGVWLQVMITGARHLRLAPLFFILGAAIGLLSWKVYVFGAALALALTGMLGNWRAVFWILPVTLAGAAALFRSLNALSVLLPVMCLIPALLGVRPERPLAWVLARASKQPATNPSRRRHRPRSASAEPRVP
ncbi:MAG TPA: hypothetical protein VK178_03070 [Opitutaceae bacterium]|nr:hypothetical protein [Opitutaceae bacterium]